MESGVSQGTHLNDIQELKAPQHCAAAPPYVGKGEEEAEGAEVQGHP